MENRPVIRLWARRIQPEYEKRFLNWHFEAYAPLMVTIPGIEKSDFYNVVKENPEYNKTLQITHYVNRRAQVEIRSDQRFIDIQKDWATTWGNRVETVWFVAYEQIASFKKDPTSPGGNSVSEAEKSPVIHMEGYDFSNPEQERYETWFDKWGREVFIPLLMESTGLREYTSYRFIDVERTGLNEFSRPKTVEYPPYLSILTFDNINAFENYESSLELAAFKSALQAPFPLGLNYQWYVQYRLIRSWRK